MRRGSKLKTKVTSGFWPIPKNQINWNVVLGPTWMLMQEHSLVWQNRNSEHTIHETWIRARRDDPEHFFATRSKISAEGLNSASDDIMTSFVPVPQDHLRYHSLFNKLSGYYKYLNNMLVKPRLLDRLLSVIAVDTNTGPSGRDRIQWRKTKVNGLFYYSTSVCVGGVGKADFYSTSHHPTRKRNGIPCPNEDKAREKKKIKTKILKQSRNVMLVKNELLRSDFILCCIKVSVLFSDKNETIANINTLGD